MRSSDMSATLHSAVFGVQVGVRYRVQCFCGCDTAVLRSMRRNTCDGHVLRKRALRMRAWVPKCLHMQVQPFDGMKACETHLPVMGPATYTVVMEAHSKPLNRCSSNDLVTFPACAASLHVGV